ncbi:MAG: TetR/AcrR family transcriptional regulator [Rhizobiales bacterium]|nr:TetR/AcrR family transcriptional regulator [Hyphomicrobiales bacterium]
MNIQLNKSTARETAILNAATHLFTQYGYDKTSIADIAKRAGISKGAIYLNFKSKDKLFEALLIIQITRFGHEWMAHVEADPQGGTMARIYINMLYAMNDNKFITSMLRQDNHLFGRYLHKPNNIFKDRNHAGTKHEFITLMQQAGCIRKDLEPVTTAHVMNILSYGLVAMEQVMHKDDIPPAEEVIKTIAEIMDRALTPKDGGNSDAGKAILRQLFDAGLKQFQQQTTYKFDS